MITAEEFFRQKLQELQPNRAVITLANEMITAEQGMRWAHEFKQLHLHNVSGLLSCRYCNSKNILKDGWCDDCGRKNRPLAT